MSKNASADALQDAIADLLFEDYLELTPYLRPAKSARRPARRRAAA